MDKKKLALLIYLKLRSFSFINEWNKAAQSTLYKCEMTVFEREKNTKLLKIKC